MLTLRSTKNRLQFTKFSVQSLVSRSNHTRTNTGQKNTYYAKWDSSYNRRQFLESIKHACGGTTESFYSLTQPLLSRFGGAALRHKYDYSVSMLVMVEYPEISWSPWRFTRTPKHWWTHITRNALLMDPVALAALREFLQDAQYSLTKSSSIEDWRFLMHKPTVYSISRNLSGLGGLQEALALAYPLQFTSSNADKKSKRSVSNRQTLIAQPLDLTSPQRRRQLLDSIVTHPEVAYNLSMADILACGGHHLRRMYSNSVAAIVMTEYPEHSWLPWMFRKSPKFWWGHLRKLRGTGDPIYVAVVQEFLDSMGQLQPLSSRKQFQLKQLGLSAESAISELAVHHANALGYIRFTLLSSALKRLRGETTLEQLYSITSWKQVFEALALLRPYSGSHAWMAMTEIPLHWWKPWKFSTAPRGWFSGLVFRMEQDIVRQTAIREYFSELEEQYGIRSIEDWVKFPARKLPLVLYHRFGNIKRTILPWIYGVDVIRNTKKVPFAQQKQMRQHADSVFKVDIDGVA